jgi:hypothetical protein
MKIEQIAIIDEMPANEMRTSKIKSPALKERELKTTIYHNYIKKEAGQEVFDYFNELGVFNTNDVLILSSRHSFSYDEGYLKNIRTIFNLKLLNKLPKINSQFLKLNRILPENGYFVGCYDDISVTQKRLEAQISRPFVKILLWILYFLPHIVLNLPIINTISSAIGIRFNRSLSINDVQRIMNKNGFNFVLTKTFNNRTFFIAKKEAKIKANNPFDFLKLKKIIKQNFIINL